MPLVVCPLAARETTHKNVCGPLPKRKVGGPRYKLSKGREEGTREHDIEYDIDKRKLSKRKRNEDKSETVVHSTLVP